MAKIQPRVMIVDDELFFRKLLREILEKRGAAVVAEAADGDEAVEMYRQHRPHAVLMDIFMPQKNGIQATAEIMAIDPRARIVICSALGFDAEVEAAKQAGARRLVLKPFMEDEIIGALKEVLRGEQAPPA